MSQRITTASSPKTGAKPPRRTRSQTKGFSSFSGPDADPSSALRKPTSSAARSIGFEEQPVQFSSPPPSSDSDHSSDSRTLPTLPHHSIRDHPSQIRPVPQSFTTPVAPAVAHIPSDAAVDTGPTLTHPVSHPPTTLYVMTHFV
ncbi:unnamed protein product [Sphacelaria rigidula]